MLAHASVIQWRLRKSPTISVKLQCLRQISLPCPHDAFWYSLRNLRTGVYGILTFAVGLQSAKGNFITEGVLYQPPVGTFNTTHAQMHIIQMRQRYKDLANRLNYGCTLHGNVLGLYAYTCLDIWEPWMPTTLLMNVICVFAYPRLVTVCFTAILHWFILENDNGPIESEGFPSN